METEKDILSQETAVNTNIYCNGLCILCEMHTFLRCSIILSKLMPSDFLMALSIDKFYEQIILEMCIEGMSSYYDMDDTDYTL